MSKLEPTVGPYDVTPLKRVSWGAIFGGTFISLAIMVLLGSLGIAIGATTIDPHTGDTPSARAFGIGAGIWWIASSVLALFGGGWAAGRLAGPRRPLESTLHGLVTWSFTTTIAVALMTTAVGSMVSGAMRVLGTASSIMVQAATGGAGAQDDVSDVNSRQGRGEQRPASVRDLPDPDAIWQEVWSDAQRLLRENPRPVTPAQDMGRTMEQDVGEVTDEMDQQITDQAGQAMGQTQDRSGQVAPTAPDPQARVDALEIALARLYRNARQNVAAVDRNAVIDALVTHTGMTRAEAQDLVRDWGDRFQGAWQAQQPQPQQPQQAPFADVDRSAAAERTANIVASAAWWTFFYFIFTAVAGGVGGMLGSMRRRRDTTVDIRETRSVTP